MTIIKTEEWEIYVVVNKRFNLLFGTIGEENIRQTGFGNIFALTIYNFYYINGWIESRDAIGC